MEKLCNFGAPWPPGSYTYALKVATEITDQLSYIKSNEVFKFNCTVSFSDRNVNDNGHAGIAIFVLKLS